MTVQLRQRPIIKATQCPALVQDNCSYNNNVGYTIAVIEFLVLDLWGRGAWCAQSLRRAFTSAKLSPI